LTETFNERVGARHKVIDSGVPPYNGEGVVRILWLARDGSEVWVIGDEGLRPECVVVESIAQITPQMNIAIP
jgi:hypothetical protein